MDPGLIRKGPEPGKAATGFGAFIGTMEPAGQSNAPLPFDIARSQHMERRLVAGL
jgi:hypothetical protein